MSKKTNRFLSKFAYRKKFVGDTKRSTAAYKKVREDVSIGSTHKLPLEVEFRKKSNKNLAFSLLGLIISMVLLSFAAVPLYNLFCKVTGYGGTTARETVNIYSKVKGTKPIIIEFDSNVDKNLPWRFIPKQQRVQVVPGQNSLVFYETENLSNNDIIGTAVYNVSPNKAGKYFVKIHCFCFEEQLLKAGEKVLMPVTFYIDKDFELDPEMRDVKVLTLSYSFFKVRDVKK